MAEMDRNRDWRPGDPIYVDDEFGNAGSVGVARRFYDLYDNPDYHASDCFARWPEPFEGDDLDDPDYWEEVTDGSLTPDMDPEIPEDAAAWTDDHRKAWDEVFA